MNISVTDDQAKMIDDWVFLHDYANRSEFFRSVVRFIAQKPVVLNDVSSGIQFEEFVKRPLPEMRKMLESSGKYNKKFINEIISGLKDSPAYANN
mgnify:CR=1 FL=1